MLANYKCVISGYDSVAGHATVSVVLLNKYTGERTLRVWLDRQTHLVLKREEYHANGAVASQMRFEELRYTDVYKRQPGCDVSVATCGKRTSKAMIKPTASAFSLVVRLRVDRMVASGLLVRAGSVQGPPGRPLGGLRDSRKVQQAAPRGPGTGGVPGLR